MIIANPIYDVVFKYLLEDIEIARELLSMILGEDIISIEIKPQETTTETTGSNINILIQVRLLSGKSRTKLERVLQVFSPEYLTQDKHQMDFKGDVNEPLVKKMVDRLGRAIASDDIRDKMDVEDEIDRIFERGLSKLASEKDKIIAEKDQELVAKDQELVAKDQELVVKDQELVDERQKAETERQKNEELLKQIEELRKQLKK